VEKASTAMMLMDQQPVRFILLLLLAIQFLKSTTKLLTSGHATDHVLIS